MKSPEIHDVIRNLLTFSQSKASNTFVNVTFRDFYHLPGTGLGQNGRKLNYAALTPTDGKDGHLAGYLWNNFLSGCFPQVCHPIQISLFEWATNSF